MSNENSTKKTTAELALEFLHACKDQGLTPFETVHVMLAAAATMSLNSSTSKRADFEELAGDVFVHFAKANGDIRGQDVRK